MNEDECKPRIDYPCLWVYKVIGRDREGRLMANPPILERIAEDPVLRDTKIIAEAWDVAGAYQVGQFPGGRWAEWNDRFRDDTRRFWRGDPGCTGALATRLTGSSDLYLRDGRKPFHSINFITSHDGFTLNDLVSYAQRHNEENGENNRDGGDDNHHVGLGSGGKNRAPHVEEIDEADHGGIEHIRAQNVAEGDIRHSHAYGRDTDDDLRRRGSDGQEQVSDETGTPSGHLGDFVARE